jgi:hypothetical protein
VRALTPEEGDAGTASWPSLRRIGTSFFPMSQLPPITAIFTTNLLGCRPQVAGRSNAETCSTSATDQRESLSGLLVMYTARAPPSMHRHHLNHRAAGNEHYSRLAVHRVRVHLAVTTLLAEHPGQEPSVRGETLIDTALDKPMKEIEAPR